MKKQKDLEAGRKKLEEFRKKKAAEKAKKAAQASQVHASNGNIQDNQLSETRRVHAVDSDGACASESLRGDVFRPSASNDIIKNDVTSANDLNTDHSIPYNHHNKKKSDSPHVPEFSNETKSVYNHQEERNEASGEVSYGMEPDQSISSHILPVQETINTSSHFSNNVTGTDKFSYGNSNSMVTVSGSPEASYSSVKDVSPGKSMKFIAQDISGYRGRPDDSKMFSLKDEPSNNYGVHKSLDPTLGESNSAGFSSMFNGIGSSSSPSDNRFSGFESMANPPTPGNNRRSRPSFLDTINISRGPIVASFIAESTKAVPFGSPVDPFHSSLIHNVVDDSVTPGKEISLGEHLINGTNENKNEYHSKQQNEDFAALEQHIEDLMQEKFSLKRDIEASQNLTESLASENSSLTDRYNQQGGVVAQLKAEMEMLQEEIKARLLELESVKLEFSNVQLECKAADERANMFAAEVIGLEEKALRLRSNELKLERELENGQAEISSLKKKMSSVEKDIRDLHSTIDALQEEKKLLQSKLRKASSNGNFVDASKSVTSRKDASTSTIGLGGGDDAASTTEIMHGTRSSGSYALSFPSTNENGLFALDELSLTVPPAQLSIFQNINVLISELAIEKEELVRALSVESSHNTKLKESNKELTRKLETQTQRLELLTSQSMSSGNVPVIQADSRNLHDTTYADEGDEVVERVLGWIMKLFPGGPSKRRTSKLL